MARILLPLVSFDVCIVPLVSRSIPANGIPFQITTTAPFCDLCKLRPVGLLTWIASGLVAALAARFLLRPTRRSFAIELVVALVAAVVSGLAATALDFGGWSIVEPRAIAFALAVAAGSIALLRLFR